MNPASYSPLLLSAQITVGTAGGEVGLADSTLLENPFQGPMWLDEIRFRITTANGVGNGQYFGGLYAKFMMAGSNVPITHGAVPISLFGKVLNDAPNAENWGNLTTATKQLGYAFTWKLPKPLFIPARDLLRPWIYFQPTPTGQFISRTVNITYCCRPLPVGTPTPKVLQVPWVTSYVTPFLSTGTTDQIDQSQPSDIYNPWDQELHVQRFLGRVLGNSSDGEYQGNMIIASALTNLTTQQITMGTLVTAQDSFNNILIRDPTPFANIFSQLDRAWTVNAVLPPKGYYLFDIQRLWSTYGGNISAAMGISMVGWRNVDYSQRERPQQVPVAPRRAPIPDLRNRLPGWKW